MSFVVHSLKYKRPKIKKKKIYNCSNRKRINYATSPKRLENRLARLTWSLMAAPPIFIKFLLLNDLLDLSENRANNKR
jgi:hypothetical protein